METQLLDSTREVRKVQVPYVVVADGSQAELAVLRGAEGLLVDPGAVDGQVYPCQLPVGYRRQGGQWMLPAHEHAEVARIDALIDHLFRRGREHRHGQIHLAPVQQTGDVGQVGPLVDQVDLGVLQQKMLQEGGVSPSCRRWRGARAVRCVGSAQPGTPASRSETACSTLFSSSSPF